MSENYQTVLNHLLFHKALISETEGGQRINRYLAMLNEIDQGMHVAVRDPFEKSVVAAFELVLERQMDPWEINLVPFTKLFLDKVKKDGSVNFVTAGKLVFLAWSILKLQSDKVLLDAMPLRSLTVGDVWDEVTVFMSLLFLAHLEKVKRWQKDYPYGEIFVKRLSMEADLPTEELLAIPVLGPKPIGTPEAVP